MEQLLAGWRNTDKGYTTITDDFNAVTSEDKENELYPTVWIGKS